MATHEDREGAAKNTKNIFTKIPSCPSAIVVAFVVKAWVIGGLLMPSNASAQPAAAFDPIRCWRQSSTGAVTVGEAFTVTLTCAVFESDDTQVIPDESRLNVASIQMAPFEILGGSHPPDVRRGSRRFFQYDYQLRIISRDAIGDDVNVPALTISYRIHSRTGAAAKLEGRDLSYLLPAMPVRVLSLVPAGAGDIRDSGEAGLAAVQMLRTRARTFQATAYALAVLAAVVLALAFVPLVRRKRATSDTDRNLIPDRAILGHAASALRDTQSRAAGEGWSDDTVAAALSAARLIAAMAIGHTISQKPLPAGATVPDGRVLVRHGFPRNMHATVSSPVTADDVARAVLRNGSFSVTRVDQLNGLRASLAALTAASYQRAPKRDAAELDEAVRSILVVCSDVASDRSWWRWAKR